MREVVNEPLWPVYPREIAGTHFTEVLVGSGPVLMGAENLVLTEIRSPDLPARSQSLYGLS